MFYNEFNDELHITQFPYVCICRVDTSGGFRGGHRGHVPPLNDTKCYPNDTSGRFILSIGDRMKSSFKGIKGYYANKGHTYAEVESEVCSSQTGQTNDGQGKLFPDGPPNRYTPFSEQSQNVHIIFWYDFHNIVLPKRYQWRIMGGTEGTCPPLIVLPKRYQWRI